MSQSAPSQKSAVYLLRFRAPVHFGEDSSGLEQSSEFLHSDTLFSAICQGWAQVYGAAALVSELIKPLENYSKDGSNAPPLLITSAYPFVGDTYYLPRPFLDMYENDRVRLHDDPRLAKDFKKAQFIPVQLWHAWVRGEPVILDTAQIRAKLNDYKAAYKTWLVPRNYVPRTPAVTTPYVCRVVAYAKNAGLYFVARFGHSGIQERLAQVLTYLQDMGLGGERSSGYGYFNWEVSSQSESDIVGVSDGGQPLGYISLSLTTLDDTGSVPLTDWRYSLVRRRGYTTPVGGRGEQLRKKSLLLLGEGSIVRGAQSPRGRFFDITPDDGVWQKTYHSVYRNALAFAVPHTVEEVAYDL